MPPIPIYSKSPINASKASGVTPQTADGAGDQSSYDVKETVTTVLEAVPQNQYPPAQPGAVPSLPVPTGASQPRQYAPLQPTPTRSLGIDGPPAPQPGAVPIAPGATSTLPPPPHAGQTAHQTPVQTPAPQMPYPAQMSIPSPAVPTAQRGTSTAFVRQVPVPTNLGFGTDDNLEHPPGYQQNVNATDMTSSQRAATEAAASEAEARAARRSSRDAFDEGQGVWDMTKKFVQAAGGKLQEAESEVWKRINKE